jgi:hypothetical protein
VLLSGVVWFNYTHLVEAFGNGPPYYGRTMNMDKWTNPVPILLVIDTITILLLSLLVRFGFHKVRT